MQKFRRAAKVCALLAALSTGACAQSPLDLIAPTDLALMQSDKDYSPSDPLSVEVMLARVRGDFSPQAAPVNAQAHGMTGTDVVVGSVTEMPQQITLEQLRQQVEARDVPATPDQGCK